MQQTSDNKQNMQNVSEQEHVLVCLSASPTNVRIVRAAANMAQAYGAQFTAVYVRRPSEQYTESDRRNLEAHISLAEHLGADVVTLYGEDISEQIAAFARMAGVTQIMIGKSKNRLPFPFRGTDLTERLIESVPNMEVHILPDASYTRRYQYFGTSRALLRNIVFRPVDLLITVLILTAVTLIGLLFRSLGFTESNMITIYILGVLLTALFTKGYVFSTLSAVMSVILFNFFLTEPRFTFHVYGTGYPVTFAIMLIASMITGTLAARLKDHAKISAQSAYRTKVMFDTNQFLQQAESEHEIIEIAASQIMKLLDRDVIAYGEKDGRMLPPSLFPVMENSKLDDLLTEDEELVAQWTFENRKRAGASTAHSGNAKGLYLAIRRAQSVYGVIGIALGDDSIEPMESSMVLSIMGECALAIDNMRNAIEKEAAAVVAKNEQLRADLLRTISHDLRTPLTTISGNADNLLTNYDALDDETRQQVFTDIYEDAQWLNSLVENLLSVSRIEDGTMNLNLSTQLIDEVIDEALQHVNRKHDLHRIVVESSQEMLMAKMDARLIVQVLINLIGNALKYTPNESRIRIWSEEIDDMIHIHVADEGPGIPDEEKTRIFEMFYTGGNRIADSRRSLGLGLALCRSIITAHQGKIWVTDNDPRGSVFTFTLPTDRIPLTLPNIMES